MNIYEIIKRPVVTEGTTLLAAEHNQFTFEVDLKANKIQIKQAVEQLFTVDVLSVSTMIMPMKRGRRGRKEYARTAAWKKAIVKLADGQKIEYFNI